MIEFQGSVAPASESTIEFFAPPVEAEETLTSEWVKKLTMVELRTLSKKGNKATL